MEKKIWAKDLGINLKSGRERELFKWFLACKLFGKPIQQDIAARTFHEFEKAKLTSPDAILEAGWQNLVNVLGRGHYVRYDESTARQLLEDAQLLKEQYQGKVGNVLKIAKDKKDLQKRLQEFKGIGPKTSGIFVRDIEKEKLL